MKKNPMFDEIEIGNLIYLGSHPWNTGDVFGHGVIVEKDEWGFLLQAIDVRSACEWSPTRRGVYHVMFSDTRKIIRLA
jgi:hypothetical protein